MNFKLWILNWKYITSLQTVRLLTMLEGFSLSFLPALSLNLSLSLSLPFQAIDFCPFPPSTTDSQAVGLWEIFILIDPGGWWVCYERCSSNSLGPTNISKYQSATGGLRTDTRICLWMPRRLNRQEKYQNLSVGWFLNHDRVRLSAQTYRLYVSIQFLHYIGQP